MFVALVVTLLVVATLLRVSGLGAGLPYSSYIDEGHYLHPTAHMIANDTFEGGSYQNPYEHPSLPYDAIALAAEVYRLTGDTGIKAGAVATDETSYYDLIQPSELILIGRLVILAFSVGAVLLTVLLATRMIGRRGGLLAGSVVAFLPVLVTRSAVVTADPVVTFFVTATLLLTSYLVREGARARPSLLWAGLAGAGAGMAFTSKYPAGAVILAVFTVIALRRDLSPAVRAWHQAVALISAIIAATVTMPALVFDTSQVIADVKYEANAYSTYIDGHYWSWMTNGAQIGWLFSILAVGGLVLLVRARPSRILSIAWLVFAVPYVGYLVAQTFQPVRNLMPLLPFLAVAVAAAILELVRLISRVWPLDRRGRAAGSVALTAVVVITMFFGGVTSHLRTSSDLVDSRTEAVDWLEREVSPGQTVLVVEELAILPAELARIPGTVTVSRAYEAEDPPDLAAFDFVVSGAFRPGPYAPGTPVWVPAGATSAATFGTSGTVPNPNTWRSSDEIVTIYRNP